MFFIKKRSCLDVYILTLLLHISHNPNHTNHFFAKISKILNKYPQEYLDNLVFLVDYYVSFLKSYTGARGPSYGNPWGFYPLESL